MLSSPQDLTVAFVVHNEAKRLKALLGALEQVEGLDSVATVLFIDNASTDETLNILKAFQETSSINVTLAARKTNHMGQARNDALTMAKTRWLLFCDADCLPPSDWVKKYLQILNELSTGPEGACAGVGGPASPLAEGMAQSMAQILSFAPWTHLHSAQGALKEKDWDADHLPCSNALMDRPLILNQGGFCNSLAQVGEDLELGLRLSSQGYRWRVVPGLQIHHNRDFRVQAWARKMLAYGRAQIRVARLRGRLHLRAGAALFAATGAVLWLILLGIQPLSAFWLAVFYGICVALQVVLCPKVGWRYRLYAFFLVPLTHIFYASGALLELVAPKQAFG